MCADWSKPYNSESASPETDTRLESDTKGDDWICRICYNKITSDKDRFYYEGNTEFNFTNPHGVEFDIITFSAAEGCVISGEATHEFSWFPHHSWTFSHCSRCKVHLGWKYFGSSTFYGLMRNRIIKALTIMN